MKRLLPILLLAVLALLALTAAPASAARFAVSVEGLQSAQWRSNKTPAPGVACDDGFLNRGREEIAFGTAKPLIIDGSGGVRPRLARAVRTTGHVARVQSVERVINADPAQCPAPAKPAARDCGTRRLVFTLRLNGTTPGRSTLVVTNPPPAFIPFSACLDPDLGSDRTFAALGNGAFPIGILQTGSAVLSGPRLEALRPGQRLCAIFRASASKAWEHNGRATSALRIAMVFEGLMKPPARPITLRGPNCPR